MADLYSIGRAVEGYTHSSVDYGGFAVSGSGHAWWSNQLELERHKVVPTFGGIEARKELA